ncbi:hypothetical protein WDU94_014740, partial [Cyamophila willieti]
CLCVCVCVCVWCVVCVCVCVCVCGVCKVYSRTANAREVNFVYLESSKSGDGSTWDSFFGKLKINTLNAKSLRSHMETRHQCQLNVFLGGNTLWYYAFIEEE